MVFPCSVCYLPPGAEGKLVLSLRLTLVFLLLICNRNLYLWDSSSLCPYHVRGMVKLLYSEVFSPPEDILSETTTTTTTTTKRKKKERKRQTNKISTLSSLYLKNEGRGQLHTPSLLEAPGFLPLPVVTRGRKWSRNMRHAESPIAIRL